MSWNDQGKSFPIVVRKIKRRAETFGTSALELMLMITFLILLMLLAYFAPIISAQEAQRAATEAHSAMDRPHEMLERIASLERNLDTALAEKRLVEERLHDAESSLEEAVQELEEHSGGGLLEKAEELVNRFTDDGHKWPPIIRLRETDGYSFRTNSSEIRPAFQRLLVREIVPRIRAMADEFETDTIDIVGHTDERSVTGQTNLDDVLVPFLNNRAVQPLRAADNAGLGFARAAAVARLLSSVPSLSNMRVVPMSGAQVILLDGVVSNGSDRGNVPSRRRIEIRVRRSDRGGS